jgi:transglutaminase-like putative cysteine protease
VSKELAVANTDHKQNVSVHVGCDVLYQSEYATPMILTVRPQHNEMQQIVAERRIPEPFVPIETFSDSFGNQQWRLSVPVGSFRLRYDAVVRVPAGADPVLPQLDKMPIELLPGEVLTYTLPSRYCQSDLLMDESWQLFGDVRPGWAQVQAICDWMHANIAYAKGSTSTTSAVDVFAEGRGVCRDFAHLAITFCRALNIPARYVCGYLPEIAVEPDPTPMDFHAWFEVYLEGGWRTFDARHNSPRIGRILIASGRDAVDVAWATIYGGAQLTHMGVTALEVDEQFTFGQELGVSQAKV